MPMHKNRLAVFLTAFSLVLPCISPLWGSSGCHAAYTDRHVLADSILSSMSLKEKVAQLMIVEYSGRMGVRDRNEVEKMVREGVGGLIVMADSLASYRDFTSRLKGMAEIPLWISIDGEWGPAMRFSEIEPFPKQMQLGALDSDSLVFVMGREVGKQCRALGISVNFVPDVDINNNPDNPVINLRSFGDDREKVAAYGAAYFRGLSSAGVAGSAKHFPGHGDTEVDSHHDLPSLDFDRKRLDSLELYPFRRLIGEGVDMVMVGHLNVPAIDSSGYPASLSERVIKDLLKDELGFKGIVITDALNMKGVAAVAGDDHNGLPGEYVPVEAFKAGCDVLLMPEHPVRSLNIMTRAFENGTLDVRDLDARCRKVLLKKMELGLLSGSAEGSVADGYAVGGSFVGGSRAVKDKAPEYDFSSDHLPLVGELSASSITLIRNEDGFLPLPVSSDMKIACIGLGAELSGDVFAEVLKRYAAVDTFCFRNDFTVEDMQVYADSLRTYDSYIIAIHNTDARPQMNFGLDSLKMEFVYSLASVKPSALVFFGSPYAVNVMGGLDSFKAVAIAYSFTGANNYMAAQMLFGGLPFKGVLPVSLDGYERGFSVRQPERRTICYEYSGSGRFFDFRDGVIAGPVIPGEGSIYDVFECGKSSAVFSLLPALMELVEEGRVKLSSPVPSQDGKRVSDLVTEYSEYDYLHEMLLGFFGNEMILSSFCNGLYSDMGMVSTRYEKGKVFTTVNDLCKFASMLDGFAGGMPGRYGGKVFFSAQDARMLRTLASFYMDSDSECGLMKVFLRKWRLNN